MTLDRIRIGFLPLVDAGVPILAHELGLAEEEGLSIELVRDMTWATVRDRLLYGHSDAAHLVAPLAIATSLGRGRPPASLSVPFVLGLNGNAVTLAPDLADAVVPGRGLGDPRAAGIRLAQAARARRERGARVRIGVVHRYSSHNYMLRYWLAECGLRPDEDIEIVTISPPFAADALAAGEVDGICVGEPWNSVAVERGAGRIVLVTAQIWRRGVEKVLALRTRRMEEAPDLVDRLIRALHRAAARFADPALADIHASILARPAYLDGSADMIRRAISDRILLGRGTEPVHIPDFMFQYRQGANFPWVSQAAWLYSQMVRWDKSAFSEADAERARRVFRPDVYRRALAGTGAPLPGASSKLEGAIDGELGAGSVQGRLLLGTDLFFDGRAFDPDHIADYLRALPG
ncbi:ABC transporter substrate-binding protein [Sphingosinicella terrae]|uniref:ABC transporter substrate-binding protein n=1 Tax=Sphingosinicella terrae TaxID=2172047 RepID=UPI000E0DA3C9|nr:ABC transporter substrate-binding protein [Sphingosinicella terrae]